MNILLFLQTFTLRMMGASAIFNLRISASALGRMRARRGEVHGEASSARSGFAEKHSYFRDYGAGKFLFHG